MNSQEIRDLVLSVIQTQLNKPISNLAMAERKLHHETWDSLKHVEILLALKEVFPDIVFRANDFQELNDVGDIIDFIEQKNQT